MTSATQISSTYRSTATTASEELANKLAATKSSTVIDAVVASGRVS